MLASHERVTLCCLAAAPLPVTAAVTGELDALLVNETVAVVAPLVCGSKARLNEAVPPAGIVSGKAGPVSLNSAPLLTDAAETVMLPPVALSVIGKVVV